MTIFIYDIRKRETKTEKKNPTKFYKTGYNYPLLKFLS